MLKLEIVESTVVADVTRAAQLINGLKQLGVPVWLDDFGTGYSALSYLPTLAFQGVKLDASFVARMTRDARDFALVKTIIDLLQYLEMSCVAEGVETRDQHELLALAGCELCQGYGFAHPMPAAAAGRLLESTGVRCSLCV
jgi:EAL domain-containing protein (putative c-di-GMP-specific phosphodiesterase class I)